MKLLFRKLHEKETDYECIWLMIAGLAVLFFFFLLDPVQRNVRCLFKSITGIPCLTCGMVRALMSLCDLDPVAAFLYNPLVTVIYVLTGIYLVYAAAAVLFNTRRLRIDRADRKISGRSRAIILLLLACNWLYLILAGR